MYEDWEVTAQHREILFRASAISAAIRAADDANWDLDDNEIDFNPPFDPLADDVE